MNDDQLLELRLWAGRLASDTRPDVQTAAKAIVMLVDEIEALRAKRPQPNDAIEAGAETAPVGAHAEGEIGSALRGRLRSFARKRLSTPEGTPLSQNSQATSPCNRSPQAAICYMHARGGSKTRSPASGVLRWRLPRVGDSRPLVVARVL